jgi:hypothetical protein
MIGPWRPDISPERPGIICAKCKEPIFVQDGHWQSRYPDRWFTKRGIHIPQPIMPWHNQSQTRWAQIIQLVKDPLLPKYRLYNEVYGEPFDSGAGLLGEMDIKRAANLRIPYNVNRAKDLVQDYSYRMLAIDWGGGSLKYLDKNDAGPAPLSRTKIAVLGLSHHGTVDVLWGWENANPLDRQLETRMVLETLNRFRCNGLAYDTGNGGYFSEMIMKMQASVHTNIFRIGYGANLKQELFCRHASNPETGEGVYYTLDKTRSLILLAQAIKAGRVRFFNPYMGDEKDTLQTMGRALLSDFTNLKQEQIERAGGGSFSIITKLVGTSDDFANAVNFGTVAIWHQFGYPDINLMLDDFFTPQDAAALNDGSFILSESLSSRVKEIWEALGV